MTRLAGLVLIALAAAGCGGASDEGTPTGAHTAATSDDADAAPRAAAAPPAPSTPTPAPTSTPTVAPTPASPPPPPAAYRAGAHEVHPSAKTAAARIAQALTTYEVGTDTATLVAALVDDRGRAADLAAVVEPLVERDRWSRGHVVYPQLGGVGEDAISVMVVVDQRIGSGAEPERSVTRTLDVRLVRSGGAWVLDRVASVGGEEVPRPDDLPPVARQVLDDPRITLPASARWDIHRGVVATELLEVMRDLAERAPYAVVSLSSGHPFHVFGTERLSNHTRGRAVDIRRIDGTDVIDDRDAGSTTHDLVRWLYDLPQVSEIGSPWALDGYGGRSFSDVVHQDHVHIGVRPSSR